MKKITSIGILLISASAMAQASSTDLVTQDNIINKPVYSENIAKILDFENVSSQTAFKGFQPSKPFCNELWSMGPEYYQDWILFGCN